MSADTSSQEEAKEDENKWWIQLKQKTPVSRRKPFDKVQISDFTGTQKDGKKWEVFIQLKMGSIKRNWSTCILMYSFVPFNVRSFTIANNTQGNVGRDGWDKRNKSNYESPSGKLSTTRKSKASWNIYKAQVLQIKHRIQYINFSDIKLYVIKTHLAHTFIKNRHVKFST